MQAEYLYMLISPFSSLSLIVVNCDPNWLIIKMITPEHGKNTRIDNYIEVVMEHMKRRRWNWVVMSSSPH
jgi:hypothetical protein